MVLGGFWCLLVVIGCFGVSWWFCMVLDGFISFLMVLGSAWWFLVVLCGS